jgi:hypothetical protein
MRIRVQKSWTRRALLLAALVHIIEEKHHEDLIRDCSLTFLYS